MAMFKWGGAYINPDDVTAIFTSTDSRQSRPFYMAVRLRDGKEYQMSYQTESSREVDAARLANLVNRRQPDPVSRAEIEGLLDRLKGALRRDIKALREEIAKGE